MKLIPIAALAGTMLAAGPAMAVTLGGQADPDEVVAKVRKAAALLAREGEAGLEVIRDRRSEFTWKDTYVFVVNCEADEVLANPAFPERQGGDIKQHTDYNGKQYGLELCKTAQLPGGGWVEYVWLKPGGEVPLRKISFVMSVEGRPYQLGAGIYDKTVRLEDLAAVLEMSK
ncbi:MAG: cache domain-containing protein [Alphaproteobacteria bacterium]|nr:cache domain-containing protein [Alphaproteobacteria bacterium]